MKLHIQKTIGIIMNHHAKDIREGINFSEILLIKHKIKILKCGHSFTAIFKRNISELETRICNFFGKLCLTYYFRDSTYEDKSIIKNVSTFTANINEYQELGTICKKFPRNKIYKKNFR